MKLLILLTIHFSMPAKAQQLDFDRQLKIMQELERLSSSKTCSLEKTIERYALQPLICQDPMMAICGGSVNDALAGYRLAKIQSLEFGRFMAKKDPHGLTEKEYDRMGNAVEAADKKLKEYLLNHYFINRRIGQKMLSIAKPTEKDQDALTRYINGVTNEMRFDPEYQLHKAAYDGFKNELDEKYTLHLTKANTETLNSLRAHGIDLNRDILMAIQPALIAEISSLKVPPTLPESESAPTNAFGQKLNQNPIGKQEISDLVRKTTLLNDHLKDYLKLDPDFAKQASPLCAFGGRNAFFFRSTIDHQPYFFICPGYLLKFSQESYKENAINVLGHELAHAMHDSVFMGEDRIKEHFDVDVFAKNSRFTFNRYNVDARYTPFTDCMTKYYTPEAQSCESIVEYYAEKAIPTLLSLAQKQENKHYSKPEKTAFFAKFQNQLKAVYSNCKITGRWHGYDDEMISDQAANEITVARLKNIAPAKRAETLKSVYSLYCVMNVSLDLSHPPAEARISNVFHNPALRKLLGCTVDIPDGRPYCSFSTSSPGR